MKMTRTLSILLPRLLDLALVMTLGWIALPYSLQDAFHLSLWFASPVMALVLFSVLGLYHSWRGLSLWVLSRQVFIAWTILAAILGAIIFISDHFDLQTRTWLQSWFFGLLAAMLMSRWGVYALLAYLRKRGANRKYVLLVGEETACQRVQSHIARHRYSGYQVINRISLEALLNYEEVSPPADELWLLLPFSQAHHIEGILSNFNQSMLNIRWLPDDSALFSVWQSPRELLGMTALDLRVSPMDEPINRWIKSTEDRLLALSILLAISPLLLLIAFAVKYSSPGPVFYRQLRHGWNGEPFKLIKFRTMVLHDEPNGQIIQATEKDTRITAIGSLLRRTSLDELPQFINVLRGEMSVVGPRPHAVAHNDYYSQKIDGYMLRHKVKPGITGWAQVNGWRGETDTLDKMQKRVEYDLWYIEHWSLWLDLKIIIMTLFKGFVHENAR